MKIEKVEAWEEAVGLERPYTIARRTIDAVTIFFVRLEAAGGLRGFGSASPAPGVTGETPEACAAALAGENLAWLEGRDLRHLGALTRELERRFPETPAARAALDMALYDLFARHLGVPVVDLLGRCHDGLVTSITIGIQSTEEALAEAEEYVGRGFRCLKVKIGRKLDEDLERLEKLRERVGAGVAIRVDGNQGYHGGETDELVAASGRLGLEFIEQPMPRSYLNEMLSWTYAVSGRMAADESLHGEADAQNLVADNVFGIFNVKLMKCGGITPALGIARTAELYERELMWGCMDESALSIAAALHAAYASPATRYLDLDGHLDLAKDPFSGGFWLEDGRLYLDPEAGSGLGVELGK